MSSFNERIIRLDNEILALKALKSKSASSFSIKTLPSSFTQSYTDISGGHWANPTEGNIVFSIQTDDHKPALLFFSVDDMPSPLYYIYQPNTWCVYRGDGLYRVSVQVNRNYYLSTDNPPAETRQFGIKIYCTSEASIA